MSIFDPSTLISLGLSTVYANAVDNDTIPQRCSSGELNASQTSGVSLQMEPLLVPLTHRAPPTSLIRFLDNHEVINRDRTRMAVDVTAGPVNILQDNSSEVIWYFFFLRPELNIRLECLCWQLS